MRLSAQKTTVNCRVGSLEMDDYNQRPYDVVNCRVGSLEIRFNKEVDRKVVNCRVGSLETDFLEPLTGRKR